MVRARAVAVVAGLLLATTPAFADRWMLDLEPLAIHGRIDGVDGPTPVSMMVATFGRMFSDGNVAPYVAAGGGFLTVQARVGVLVRSQSGLIARLEVRPQIAGILCGDTAVLANAAGGYRWRTGSGRAISVIAGVDAGPAWLAPEDACDDDQPFPETHDLHAVVGGQMSVLFDW